MLYYISKKVMEELKAAPGPELLAKAGLEYLLDEGENAFAMRDAFKGPDGGPGTVFQCGKFEGEECGYWPDSQTWSNAGNFWLGMAKDCKFKPEHFARAHQLPGHRVRLAAGNEWLIPVARAVDGSTPLPRPLRWKDGGWFYGPVAEQFREYFAHACALWDTVSGAAETGLTVALSADFASMALAFNYRIGPEEISMLGLLDSTVLKDVVMASIDYPALPDLKKNIQPGQ